MAATKASVERCTRAGYAAPASAFALAHREIASLGRGITAASPPLQVHGAGEALVTDPDNVGFESIGDFNISAGVNPNGRVHGSVNFMFGPELWQEYPPTPEEADVGVIATHVWGQVTQIDNTGGSIVLSGVSTEVDVVRGGQNYVFENEPFWVEITGPQTFIFQWCLLPPFYFQVTKGGLTY